MIHAPAAGIQPRQQSGERSLCHDHQSNAGFQDRTTNNIGFHAFDQATNKNGIIIIANCGFCFGANLIQSCLTIGFISNFISGFKTLGKTL
jgi:hypothetical protein